ncbi:MAG: pyridoxamine 5'-phosphate oxidase family protein [Thiotrichales bacterium]|nr:pyridoxamine 5'-phosphate oxidase family protein [Thiotrichales bacterium]
MKPVEAQCQTFLKSRHSMMLSTLGLNGELETSVVPFVELEAGVLAILVSELAQHTQNLFALLSAENIENAENPSIQKSAGLVAGLLVADEASTEQLFARERLSLQMRVQLVAGGTEERSKILRLMQAQFGEVIEVLAGLPDFHCFKLQVKSGRYVKGFGAAYAFVDCPCIGLQGIKGR